MLIFKAADGYALVISRKKKKMHPSVFSFPYPLWGGISA